MYVVYLCRCDSSGSMRAVCAVLCFYHMYVCMICMYVCMYVCTYVWMAYWCIHVCMHLHKHILTHTFRCLSFNSKKAAIFVIMALNVNQVYVCMYVCMYVSMYLCMFEVSSVTAILSFWFDCVIALNSKLCLSLPGPNIYIYIHIYIYIYTYLHTYIYIHTRTHTHIFIVLDRLYQGSVLQAWTLLACMMPWVTVCRLHTHAFVLRYVNTLTHKTCKN